MPKNPYKLISPQAGRHSEVCDPGRRQQQSARSRRCKGKDSRLEAAVNNSRREAAVEDSRLEAAVNNSRREAAVAEQR